MVRGVNYHNWGGTGKFVDDFMINVHASNNKIHFNLTKADGSMMNAWEAYSDGARGLGASKVTHWEFFQIQSNPQTLERTTFYHQGKVVINPLVR